MTVKSDYTSGTISLTNGSATVTGSGTAWAQPGIDVQEGDTLLNIPGAQGFNGAVIAAAVSDTELTLVLPWEGPTLAGVTYRLRFQPDGSRVKAESRNLIEMLSGPNIPAFQALDGTGGDKIPMFTGTGAMTVISRTDLIAGVHYDVQVDTLADRDAYDAEPAGFSVLVSDVGDGRSAIYSKVTNTLADWSAPAYITGPVGPLPDVEVGTTTTLPPGSPASVTPTPIPGGVSLAFGIPAGEGFYWEGAYNPATAYQKDDVVRFNGSTFIALQATTGNSPSGAFPPVDTAFWAVLASKGQDGLGTGDVVGPNSAVDGRIASFDGTTGKRIEDSGVPVGKVLRFDQAQVLAATEKAWARANAEVGILSAFRSKVISGGFDFFRQPSGSSGYIAERWLFSPGAGATNTISQADANNAAYPPYVRKSLFWQRSVAGTSPSQLIQKIENVNTLAGRRVTVEIWAGSSAPTELEVYLAQVFGTGGSPSATVNTSVQSVNTGAPGRYRLYFDLPAISGKVYGTNGDDALWLVLRRPHNATNPTTGMVITAVSISEGEVVGDDIPFDWRDLATVRSQCDRFYETGRTQMNLGSATTGAFAYATQFRQVKRRVPDMTSAFSYSNASGGGLNSISVTDFNTFATPAATGNCYFICNWTADAEI